MSARVTLARGLPYLPCKRSAKDNSRTRDNFPPSCVTSNIDNLNGIIISYKHLNNVRYFLYTMIILPLFLREFNMFSTLDLKFSWTKSWTKHVIIAGKVDPGDRVTLLVKFACKPELTFTRLLG